MYLDILNHCSNAELVELITDKEKFNFTCNQFYLVKHYNQKDYLDAMEAMHIDLMEVVSKRFVELVHYEQMGEIDNLVHDHDVRKDDDSDGNVDLDWPW